MYVSGWSDDAGNTYTQWYVSATLGSTAVNWFGTYYGHPEYTADWAVWDGTQWTYQQYVVADSLGGSCPPSAAPIPSPTSEPTTPPTPLPTSEPTSPPTPLPTYGPTYGPTPLPTSLPSPLPSSVPTSLPTALPTGGPTPLPSTHPSPLPTTNPTPGPSPFPTPEPSIPIVWDDGGADGGEYGYADDNDDADDDGGIDPLFLLSFLTSGGNEPGYVKVDRTDTSINHAGTDSGAFLYYVYGPNGVECPAGACLPDGIPEDWKCDGATYFAADGVW